MTHSREQSPRGRPRRIGAGSSKAARAVILATLAALAVKPAAAQLTTVGVQMWTQDSPGIHGGAETSDQFGTTLAAGDFNGDGYDDLAIGVPWEAVGSETAAGAVNLLFGGPGGLGSAGNLIIDQDSDGVPGTAGAYDHFGWALAAGDLDTDGADELLVGVPDEDGADGLTNFGMVQIFTCDKGTTSCRWDRTVTMSTLGFLNQSYAEFGAALACGPYFGDLLNAFAVGAPGFTIDDVTGAGAVIVHDDWWTGEWYQGATNFPGTPGLDVRFGASLASGDLNGDGVVDLTVGVPGEEVQGVFQSGAVTAFSPATGWYHVLSLDATESNPGQALGEAVAVGRFGELGQVVAALGVPNGQGGSDPVESGKVSVQQRVASNQWYSWERSAGELLSSPTTGALVGAALTVADVDGDGIDELVVGAPYQEVDGHTGAGAVVVVHHPASDVPSSETWSKEIPSVGLHAENSDRFGSSLAAGDFNGSEGDPGTGDDLAVGAPGATVSGQFRAGGVVVLYSAAIFRDGFEDAGSDGWTVAVPP